MPTPSFSWFMQTMVSVSNYSRSRHQVYLQQICISNLVSGLQKQYTLPCLEAEILQATVDKDMFPTFLLAEAGELNRYYRDF